jgi:hypothetical protein
MAKRTDFNDLGRIDFGLVSEVSKCNLPEPLPLVPEGEPPAPYPLDALGHVLGKAAKAIAEHVQVPDAMAGQSVLAAAALAAQPHINVEIDGRIYPVSLFNITIAYSGDRKSTADRYALSAHSDFQRTLYHRYLEEKEQFDRELQEYHKDPKGMERPKAPRQPFLLIDEPTLEGVYKAFRDGRPSQGLFNDEGGQFIGGHAMNKDNILKTIAGLSKLWDGTPVNRVRGGRDENLMLYDRRFSCHLMLQPIVADIVLNNRLLQGQGILARFLISKPESLAGTRLYHASDPTQDAQLGLYWSRMTELLKMPLPVNDYDELEPRALMLSTEAKRLWIEAYNTIERQLGPKGQLIDIKATAAKAADNILRIAANTEFVDDPDCTHIEADSLHDAIRLMEYSLNEALRLAHTVHVPEQMEQAQEFLKWLREHMKEGVVTVRDICRRGPPFARSASIARKLFDVLERHYWVVAEGNGWSVRQ